VPKNITAIDKYVLDVWIETTEDKNSSHFNFTWHVVEYKPKYISLQLDFTTAYYITSEEILHVNVLIKEFFIAADSLLPIQDENLQHEINCIPQIQLDDAASIAATTANIANIGTKGILAANFALNLVVSSALSLLWGMINGLQILSVLPLANCDMPGNAQFVFNIIYLIASFNLINVDVVTNWVSSLFRL